MQSNCLVSVLVSLELTLNEHRVISTAETRFDLLSTNHHVMSLHFFLDLCFCSGIVKFTTAFKIDNQGGTTLSLPEESAFTVEPDLSGTNTYPANVKDGQTLTFWVRAYDIRNVYDEESVTVHVDSSPPIIHSVWLTKADMLNLSLHSLDELHKMT